MKNKFLAATAAAALIVAAGAAQSQTATDTQGGDRKATGQQTQGPEPKKAQGAQSAPKTAPSTAEKKVGTDGAKRQTTENPQGPEPKKAQTTQGRTNAPVADKKAGADGANRTTSTEGTQGPKELNDEQRTKISSSMRSHKNLHRVDRTKINFTVNVGTVVPRSVNLAPLPAPIVSVVPAYRGYLYVVVGNDLLIIHPRTHEIVAVLPA
jgi:hypothetical protein